MSVTNTIVVEIARTSCQLCVPKENAKPTNSGVLVVSASIHTGNVISDAIALMEAMKKAVLRRHAQCTDSPVLMVTALILNGSVTVTMIAVTSQMRPIVVPSLALRGKQNAAIPMRASTPRGFVMGILTVKMDGMKAKPFVTKPVVLVAFVARQGIVSLCSGVVMVSMIVVMAVMKCSAKSITSHVPVDSLLVGTVVVSL